MYLDFIKDIFKPNDSICIVCGNEKYEGSLLKISSELIAIKTPIGIIIKKDEEISDVYSLISKDSENPSHNEINDNTQASSTIDENDIGVQLTDIDSSVDPKKDDTNESGVNIPDTSDQLNTQLQESDKETENPKEDVFRTEIPTPNLKVVGFVDLTKIKDTRKKKYESRSIPADNKIKNNVDNKQKTGTEDGVLKNYKTFTPSEKEPSHNNESSIIEKRINSLLQVGKAEEALSEIEDLLSNGIEDKKLKSSLLLKKAQTFSALSEYEKAKKAYQELIAYNESVKSSANNLSHLYTELARLQNLTKENKEVVLSTLKKALKYNPNNAYASTLVEQISSGWREQQDSNNSDDDKLKLESEEMSTSISKMIDIDIKEHIFTHERILKNGGKSTPTIAKLIYEEAKGTRDVDLSERYPIYLEAAKAYSDLPVGSYDTQEYLESVAYYAILKGNSLFVRFKRMLFEDSPNITLLTHIKDSACSYYVESLSLLSNIEGEHLLTILANYLKMNIALNSIKNGEEPKISGQFNKVFFNCVNSEDPNVNLIAWGTIIAIGTASAKAWNNLTSIKGGTRGLYGIMASPQTRQNIYSIINRVNGDPVDLDLLPGDFLKKSFINRKERNKQFRIVLSSIMASDFNIYLLSTLDESWRSISDYLDLLSETDLESKRVGDRVLQILLPYSNRQSQMERTNLLYQAQDDLDKQISFINANTTYYGRTFFFPLFTMWKSIIQQNLQEKISKTLPVLQVIPDPPYLLRNGNDLLVNFIIKNVGESTAEGYHLDLNLKSIDNGIEIKGKSNEDIEIPVGCHFDKNVTMPSSLKECKAVEMSADISSIYQGEKTSVKTYKFTLELEPKTKLTEDDIIWTDGPKMFGPLFKGRQDIMSKLSRHYLSVERGKPYILYGLTRTGKSSILLNLKREIDKKTLVKEGETYQILTFEWDFSEASGYGNAKDMWQYFLRDTLYDELGNYLSDEIKSKLIIADFPRAKDFKRILQYLKGLKKFPMFFVDEFSHIKNMLDSHIINTSFLHTLRQFSLEGLASFIFAGTYDIKELIKDPKYSITGQLVHTIEEQINEIDSRSAEELINIMEDKLTFTEEAIKHIHLLSGDVPYFIQIICKFCGYYAVDKKRRYIGKPELEDVIKILTGEMEGEKDSLVKVLPKSIFQNNLYSPQDKEEINVLISSLCYLNKGREIPQGISIPKLHELWNNNGIEAYRPKLAEAISLLLERKVITQSEDELIPIYRISVDLFRRWWTIHYSDIKLEITKIQ